MRPGDQFTCSPSVTNVARSPRLLAANQMRLCLNILTSCWITVSYIITVFLESKGRSYSISLLAVSGVACISLSTSSFHRSSYQVTQMKLLSLPPKASLLCSLALLHPLPISASPGKPYGLIPRHAPASSPKSGST